MIFRVFRDKFGPTQCQTAVRHNTADPARNLSSTASSGLTTRPESRSSPGLRLWLPGTNHRLPQLDSVMS